jgi:hypothetical protein
MKIFTDEKMRDILLWIEDRLGESDASDKLKFQIPNPDLSIGSYAGATIDVDGKLLRYHSWRDWIDTATLLQCRMLTPHIVDEHFVVISYQKLNIEDSFHRVDIVDRKEKYGKDSIFAQIDKNEEPVYLYAYRQALQNVKIWDRGSILNLGINSGDEFEQIKSMLPSDIYRKIELVGIDHCRSAIDSARANFPEPNVHLHCCDINDLERLNLPRYDLIISIGTLQSPNIPFQSIFMSLVQNYLAPNGAIILGFPNSRWVDGEMIYGAKAPNYNFSEMSLVVKDVYFCKKYLQQHKFRVTITGREYLFVTGTKIGSGKISKSY